MKKVTSVIVTHNRKELLAKCLDAVTKQTRNLDSILIVDNASTDDTWGMLTNDWLDRPSLELLSLSVNTGGAGGFNAGIRKAYNSGAEWIWVMDDDCIPVPDCLEKLLTAIEHLPEDQRDNVGFLASRVIWKDGTPCLMNLPMPHSLWIEPHSQTSNLSRISASSFVSMLISRKAVEKVGLPVKEFFIWFDDSEFSLRISEQMLCYLVSDSVVVHETARNIAALDFTQVSEKSLWRFVYGIRNEASYRFEKQGFVVGFLFCLRMLVRARRHIPQWRMRITVAKACWNGWRFRYTKYIEHV